MSSQVNKLQSKAFFASSRVLIVAGKGGVGKTTVGACVAIAATRMGCDVLLIELEGRSALESLFASGPLSGEPSEVSLVQAGPSSGRLRLAQLRPDATLADYLAESNLGPLVKRLSRTGAVDVVATAAPGIRDLIILGRIRQLTERDSADLIIVDAPASGHARSMLTTPAALADSAESGPIRIQADKVNQMLSDPTKCQVSLVTLAEETPVTETIETAFDLEDRVKVSLGPVIVNSLWPPIEGLEASLKRAKSAGKLDESVSQLARFRIERIAKQNSQLERLRAELPLAQLQLPYLFTPDLGRHGVESLADALIDAMAAHD